MKFESTVENLRDAVSLAARFVQRQASLPVLNSIHLSTNGEQVVLRATNLECGVEVSVPARVAEQGEVAVQSGALVGFLSNNRGTSVSAATDGGTLKVKMERASASIKTVPHEDFPILPHVSAENSFTLKASDFSRALRSVLHCASTSNIKPELQAVLINGEGGKLYAVATDSFRLAEKYVPLKSKGGVPSLLLPARNAAELVRILDGVKGDVEVYYNDNQTSLQAGPVYYTSRLIDGTFPNYRQIVPDAFNTEAVVLREDLAQALRGLAVFNDKFMQMSLSVHPKEKEVRLVSRNADVGEEECALKAAVSGDAIAMSFNSKYFADGLLPLSGESVRLRMNGAGRPMLIQDVTDDSFFYLAMPMNR